MTTILVVFVEARRSRRPAGLAGLRVQMAP